ncbi:hypothetical protein PM082_011677 [Marasmius tenuissimus]|nr:hypothetical protein PM082_011677 [Marasmius tenuissimus]
MGIFGTSSENKLLLQELAKYDTVIILDDSGSMSGGNWKQAGKALAKLASEAAKHDEDGIEIQFLNNPRCFGGLRTPEQIKNVFKEVQPSATTPLGGKLRNVLTRYIAKYEEQKDQSKPVNFIVITDGAPNDEGPEDQAAVVLVEFARRLDDMNARLTQVGIQFIQIGSDTGAAEFLRTLDDDLKHRYGIRDMVDTTLSEPGESLDVVKALLGAINRRIDNNVSVPKPTLGERIREKFMT